VALDRVRAFVFDIDGTLVHRTGPEEVHAIAGARDVLDRVAASGRPFAVFTNGSHVPPDTFAGQLRTAGLPVGDEQVITPLCSVRAYLERLGRARVLPIATEPARTYLAASGVHLVDSAPADAVFVAHPARADFDELERAARAVLAGARLLTGSYVPAYAGANGPVLSRGAMLTAAIAKASSARPVVVGKPSRAAVRELSRRLGVPSQEVAVVGDDFGLDVALGRLGGSTTVLVRSGMSASLDLARIPERRRPDHTIGSVAELLPWL
jgi:HAD superfamily hydrolase (TIGR01450 family)